MATHPQTTPDLKVTVDRLQKLLVLFVFRFQTLDYVRVLFLTVIVVTVPLCDGVMLLVIVLYTLVVFRV